MTMGFFFLSRDQNRSCSLCGSNTGFMFYVDDDDDDDDDDDIVCLKHVKNIKSDSLFSYYSLFVLMYLNILIYFNT